MLPECHRPGALPVYLPSGRLCATGAHNSEPSGLVPLVLICIKRCSDCHNANVQRVNAKSFSVPTNSAHCEPGCRRSCDLVEVVDSECRRPSCCWLVLYCASIDLRWQGQSAAEPTQQPVHNGWMCSGSAQALCNDSKPGVSVANSSSYTPLFRRVCPFILRTRRWLATKADQLSLAAHQ
jgi:hypothetical protein